MNNEDKKVDKLLREINHLKRELEFKNLENQ